MVSVIIPAFRQAALIDRCLDSIQAQSFRGSVEVVVVDDGCPEGSGDVASQHPLAPRVVRQANAGVAAARNRGIEEARGEYFAFLDADDRWRPTKLEEQLIRLERAGPALCFTRYQRVDVHGRAADELLHPDARLQATARNLVWQNFVGCSTVVVHRACIDAVGSFPDSDALRRGGQDYALWLRLASQFPIIYTRRVLTDYTIHAGSRVGSSALKNYQGAINALSSFYDWDARAFWNTAGAPYPAVVASHTLRLARDAWRQRAR
jgi:glycosyltransferase involved in cell wall biosynthesis